MPPGSDDSTPVTATGTGLVPNGASVVAVRCLLQASATPQRLTDDAVSGGEAFQIALASVLQSSVNAASFGLSSLAATLLPWALVAGALYLVMNRSQARYDARRMTNPRAWPRKGIECPECRDGVRFYTWRQWLAHQIAKHRTRKSNPPSVVGLIPGTVEEIRYQRTGRHRGPYKHRFTSPTSMTALANGSVLIRPRTSKRAWGWY